MILTWAVCKKEGKEHGWLFEREGGEVTLALNGQRTARVTASLEEPVVRKVHAGRSRLKIFCKPKSASPNATLLANNLIHAPRSNGTDLEIASVDVTGRLLKASYAPRPTPAELASDPTGWWDEDPTEKSALMWKLIHKSGRRLRALNNDSHDFPELGIIQGDLADTGVTRTPKFADGLNTYDRLQDESKGNRSPDFEFEPLDRTDGKFAKFNTYRKQGSDKTEEIILEEGDNVAEVSFEADFAEMCNSYMLIGQGRGAKAPAYVAENHVSMGRFGEYHVTETTDLTDIDEIEERAKQYVAIHAFPGSFIDITPTVEIGGQARTFVRDALGNLDEIEKQFALAPSFGPGSDYRFWLGDEITIRAPWAIGKIEVDKDRPAPRSDIYCRVTEATLTEVDAAGNVAASLTLVPVVEKANTVGYATEIRTESR